MQNINLENGYKMKSLSLEDNESVEQLCEKCSDYYLLNAGVLPSKKEIDEIFTVLPPNKKYEDKYVLGIYGLDNELVGIVDIVKDFPNNGEWMLGLMLIEPKERENGLGKTAHKALIEWATAFGAKSFRIGVVEDNHRGANFWSSLGYTKIKEVNMEFTAKTHKVNVMRLLLL